ncbi:MAG: dihydropteroate synthase [Thermoanaerobacterales bacterium]|nr:dihydropteroate synthase [Bacillota bacterium]MDI6907040.1 dihydropteroate synthase [Thermoanaerobacterales bacterium]
MMLIGERINGLFRDVATAIQTRNPEPIQRLAIAQRGQGAAYLDLNTGPAVDDPAAVMPWLVKTVEEVVDTPLCIDAAKLPVIEAGLKAVTKGRPVINSTTAERDQLERYLAMAKEYGAYLIALTMNRQGVSRDAADRLAMAMEIVVAADELGYPVADLFIDPLVLPVNVGQEHAVQVLETIRQVKSLSDPPPRTVIGLSNVSQGCPHRPLLNRTFAAMAMAAGLDAAIADVGDGQLRETIAAGRVLLGKEIYSDAFLGSAGRRHS